MQDTVMNGLWLTVIDMTVVFIVLYVLALIIKAIKLMVAPFGDGPRGGNSVRADDAEDQSRGGAVGGGESDALVSEAAEGAEGLNAETTAVIAAALAAYLEKPAFVPIVINGKARREESLWAMAGRTRVMQARELTKRRATA